MGEFECLKDKKGCPAEAHEGLGDKADSPAIFPYPTTYPKAADHEVWDSAKGCYENYKTAYQEESLDPKQKGK